MEKLRRIFYNINKSPLKDESGKTYYHVRAVQPQKTIEYDMVAKMVETNASFKQSDAIGVMSEVTATVRRLVLDNNRVHVDGLGYFYPKVKMKKKYVTNPNNIKDSDVMFFSIGFQPEKTWEKDVTNSHLKCWANPLFENNLEIPDEVTIRKTLYEYFQENNYITRRGFQLRFNLTRYMAEKILNEWSTGEFARLNRVKVGNSYAYIPVGKTL
jgi:predicted histone-like DNA-binding protein